MAVATDIASSKIPRPSHRTERSKTPRARIPVDPSLPPSRIPIASGLSPRLRKSEPLAGTCRAARSVRRVSTPPPSSQQDADVGQLRMNGRLSESRARSPRTMAEPAALAKERVEPGGRMSTPPPAFRMTGTPPKSRILNARASIDGARPRTSRETFDTAECLRRSQSAGALVTPRALGATKRGSFAQTPSAFASSRTAINPSSSSTGSQRWSTTRQATPPPAKFSPPQRPSASMTSPPSKLSPPLRRTASTSAIPTPRVSTAGASKLAAPISQRSVGAQASYESPAKTYAARRALDEERQKSAMALQTTPCGRDAGDCRDLEIAGDRRQHIEVFNVAVDSPSDKNFGLTLDEDDYTSPKRPSSQPRRRKSSAQMTQTSGLMAQILQENRELRQRIVALEDGQHRFFGEGVFDLVNAAAATPGAVQALTPRCVGSFLDDSCDSDTELPESGSNQLAEDSSST
mmetsp:Transcript_91556/g.144695  ORF Transcript_91556/g.144695 Transcript_91556/m.144695 type:complete len:462 (+) Transcript_91556:162-1547(+)|eukprot:CAMPEP_0169085312 /NCGR_PEP_ID=MMETSP1015-20121227/13090_1 /TAXON_ID=342587 /ORGANISM="Karlodinium micrum, Strain CCMP2283" /LENGTH=461 /DNA_ID=CAMNT_0009145385 /DNA_START=162 /DNA_END=1547 /DNA_ORIENTATION=+